MTTSQFLAFGTGGGSGSPNTLTPTAYAALTTILQNGFVDGIANATQANTIWRQATTAAAGMAQFAVDHGSVNCNDDGVPANYKAAVKSALDALYIQDLSGLVALTAFTGGNQSLTPNGSQKLPGQLILQWGTVAIGSGSNVETASFSFPISFPHAVFFIGGNGDNAAASGWNPFVVMFPASGLSTSGATLIADTTNPSQAFDSGRHVRWFAIGY